MRQGLRGGQNEWKEDEASKVQLWPRVVGEGGH